MKKYLLLFLMFSGACFSEISAQAEDEVLPCGTVGWRSDWLKKFQQNPASFDRNINDTLLYVPLTIHVVGSDNGSSFFPTTTLLEALCTLNEDFEPANIQFFIEGDINYIGNSAYNNHESVIDGAFMMFENNVPNTINCYLVSDPASTGGYNLPYAGIALRKGQTNASTHTWAHEIGHALSIQHPFLGWEGGVNYDGSVAHNYSDPAPEFVYYDYTYYKDTLILDTLIIDTAYVEKTDGSNCTFAGDGFCDTRPDYLYQGWQCNNDLESSLTQHDPDGIGFRSDGTLIMSYVSDDCASRFTPEQIAAMRANLYEEKPELLYNQEPGEPVAGPPAELISPMAGEMVQYDHAYFEWQAVPNATHYLLQVSRLANFTEALTNTYTLTANSTIVEDLLNDKTYYWRVLAFSNYSFCQEFSDPVQFQTAELTALNELDKVDAFNLYPTLLHDGQIVRIDLNATAPFRLTASLFELSGKILQQEVFDITAGNNALQFPIRRGLGKGMYIMGIGNEQGQVYKKIILGN